MSEWAWVFPAGMAGLTALGLYGGWVIGRYKGESAHAMAKAAQERADEAVALAKASAADAHSELAAYKTEVVAKFATIEMLTKSEDRIADAFNRFTDRLDRLVEQRLIGTSAPRTRASRAKSSG